MTNPFILSTAEQTSDMLRAVGAATIEEIFTDQIPAEFLVEDTGLQPGLSELEIQREVARLAALNRAPESIVSFLGGGIYDHFIPAAVSAVANRSEFVTSYTPYQPEASQGTLQAFFEFQSMVARLLDMDVANASLYDGATALGEALFLALSAKPERTRIILPDTLHPDYAALAGTYLQHFGIELVRVAQHNGTTNLQELKNAVNDNTAAVVLQQPNYLGCLEEAEAIASIAHGAGALLTAVVDPISLGLLQPPGAFDADIAVAEGQGLGLRPWLGGETVGLFACKQEHIRKVPGRLVGLAQDRENRRGFVLTLQTREQHIRRAKATSNICTNHAHNALRTTIYMSLMGPQGLERVARGCARNTARLRNAIAAKNKNAVAYDAPVFKEFVVRCKQPARDVCKEMLKKNTYAGVPLDRLGAQYDNMLLVCVTEKRTDDEIDSFAAALGEFL